MVVAEQVQYVKRLDPSFVDKYKTQTPPWGPIGYVTYKRTYARKLDPTDKNSPTEEWWQTVERCVNGALELGCLLTKEEAETLYDYVFNLKCVFSGRGLWQLGTSYVQKHGQDSLQNCWFVAIENPEDFCFVFTELMLGGGVGFGIHPRHVYSLPPVKHAVKITRSDERDVDFIVPDNREGWVELLRRVLDCFFNTGKDFTYSAHCIRDHGEPIKGFGGVASGPGELSRGIAKISDVLSKRAGKKLRPIDCLDICNIIGAIVVSGNVRRSAQIALGSKQDMKFLGAKNWAEGNIPSHRGQSNNTVIEHRIDRIAPAFWDGFNGDGEAYGLLNLPLMQSHGRLEDGPDHRPDPSVVGCNPCAEIGLASYESCNLSDIFLPNCTDEEFLKAAQLLYKVQKAITRVPAIHDETNKVLKQNRRIGIGVTGFMQVPERHDPALFNRVYKSLEALDKEYSKLLGISESVKLTTVKPSGTVSLLPGCSPGVHPAFSPYYIRRVRFAADDPLVDVVRKHGYKVQPDILLDGTRDLSRMVADFPASAPEGAILEGDVSAIRQLEAAVWLQRYWSDNSVSVTIYYTLEELPEIKQWLRDNFTDHLKTVSFCMKRHGFKLPPYEEITKEQYEEMIARTQPITKVFDTGEYEIENDCSTGHCPVK